MRFTNCLAQFVNKTTISNFPKEIVGIAKEHILDCLGVTIAGSCDASGKIITSFVKNMAGEPSSTVICGGFKSYPPQAALANGTMAHALDYDDDYSDYTVVHPTAVVLPATLACAEASKASGKAVLEAYVLGVETEIAIGMISDMEDIKRGWHGTSTLGTLGATMAASKILSLSVDQTQMALGIAASSSCGLRQNFGTMTKSLHAGNAAMGGVRAAMLAASGFTASRDSLEGSFGFFNLFSTPGRWEKKLDTVDNLGSPFKIITPGVYIKQYPSCAGTHSSIDAVLYLVHKYDVRPEQVDSLQCLVLLR